MLRALNKTKQELHPNLEGQYNLVYTKCSPETTSLEERHQREILYKQERKAQRLKVEAEERQRRKEHKAQAELKTYAYVQ